MQPQASNNLNLKIIKTVQKFTPERMGRQEQDTAHKIPIVPSELILRFTTTGVPEIYFSYISADTKSILLKIAILAEPSGKTALEFAWGPYNSIR